MAWDSSWEGTPSREGYHIADGKGIQYLPIQIGEPKILPKVIGKVKVFCGSFLLAMIFVFCTINCIPQHLC